MLKVAVKDEKLLSRVYIKGFNIYKFLNSYGKRNPVPEEVLKVVCEYFVANVPKIKKPWPWFNKAMKMASGRFFSNQVVNEAEKLKQMPVNPTLKELISKICKTI